MMHWLIVEQTKIALNMDKIRKLHIKDGTGYLFNGKSYNYIIRADDDIVGGYDTMEDAYSTLQKIIEEFEL